MNALSPPEHLADATEVPQDELWFELTAAANEAIKAGQDGLAATAYLRALSAAEDLFRTGDMRDTIVPLPAIMNIACHNLAELAHRHGDIPRCRNFLDRAFERLLSTALRPDAGVPLRIACIQHLKYTIAELSDHLVQHHDSERPLSAYTAQVRSAAARVAHVAAHAERMAGPQSCGHCNLFN